MILQKAKGKKIRVEDLRVGMHIVNLDRSWMQHPFLKSHFEVTSEKQIQKLKDYGILEVYIDPEFDPGIAKTSKGAFTVSSWEKIAKNIKDKHSPPDSSSSSALSEEVPFQKELELAHKVQMEAHTIVRGVMQDIRLGKNIESKAVKRVVTNMVDSIFRNRDALSNLTRLKGYDEYTFVHSVNVCVLCLTLGRHLDFEREVLQQIGIGALLHDAGKMKVPNSILLKPGRLTDAEFKLIKKHPQYALEILEKTEGIPEESKKVALQHHERFNGRGYPFGLKGEEITLFGQMAAIVDVYDAITSDRCYKNAISPHEGIQKIYEWSPNDFNQSLVERFIQCVGIYPVGTLVQLHTEEVGIVYSINHEILLRPKVVVIYKNSNERYPTPILANLMEKTDESYKRTIVGPVNAQEWKINPNDYLPKGSLT